MSGFTDITLTCRDCGEGFVFTAGQQEFFAEKGFENQPSRCKDCNQARKAGKGGGGSYGGGSYGGSSFGGGSYGGGGGSYGGGGGGGGGKGGKGCFTCGAPDHWSRECPQAGGGRGGGAW
mmetsp:Transcript_26619/g.45183  ORF Transcript_26619/g.45183 Transcript_26619/m.45183 type:complete len:120 (+) Transcript_26619:46-405(+)